MTEVKEVRYFGGGGIFKIIGYGKELLLNLCFKKSMTSCSNDLDVPSKTTKLALRTTKVSYRKKEAKTISGATSAERL